MAGVSRQRRIRVAVDDRALAEPSGGLARMAHELLPALVEEAPDLDLVLVGDRAALPPLALRRLPRVVARAPSATPLRFLWDGLLLPRLLARVQPDVFYSLLGTVVSGHAIPSVAVCHDLAFLVEPQRLPRRYRGWWRWTTRRLVAAAAVVTPSAATRRQVLAHLGLQPERVSVIRHGVHPRFRAPADDADLRLRLGLAGPFVLWVGTREPRKNLATLLAAMARVNADRSPALDLVLVGRRGWGSEGELAPGTWIHWLNGIDDQILAGLYRQATVFAFPSHDEGFGLPVAEALAAGAAVIVSTAPALLELAGDAAVAVPADDVAGWASALAHLLDDAGARDRLRAVAPARVAELTWPAAARQTAELLRRVAEP